MLHPIIEKILLHSSNPIEDLKNLALDLNRNGASKKEIYKDFYQTFLIYQSEGKETEANMLGDLLDMVSGWYNGFNLDLKE